MPVKKKADAQPEPLRTYGYNPGKLQEMLAKYGHVTSQFILDEWAFARRVSIDQGAPVRTDLFWKIISTLNPSFFERHDWTTTTIEALCENQFVGVAGCQSSAKTHNIVGFACAWWMCDPNQSSVILCSTTAKALRKRGWFEVQKFHTTIPTVVTGPMRFGNFVDSRMQWQSKKGDDRNAITGIAVEEGETNKVADNIKGVHTRRQMVIIDEATAVPPAIFEACTNLYAYPDEFILVMIGNPRSRLDEFGKFCEPNGGWNSVTIDDEEWETKPQISGKTGICIRFDAEKSPNILNPLPDGRLISKHLPTKEKVEARRKRVGSENDPSYWSNDRGFWAPDGLNKNLFSEVSIAAYDGEGRHEFTGNDFQIIGSFDHARTGDHPCLRFAACGEVKGFGEHGGQKGIELMPPKTIPVNAKSNNPIDFQLMEQVRRECENVTWRGQKYSCPPGNLGVDATGGGADLCDIWQREWSPHIMRIIWSESASEDQCSHEDVRPANTAYKNKRAEMYHRTRNLLHARQLKGIDKETARQLCAMKFDDSKTLIVMQDKKEYKKDFGHSPDEADAAVMISEVARRRGIRIAPLGQTKIRQQEVTQEFKAAQAVYDPETHYQEEEIEEAMV